MLIAGKTSVMCYQNGDFLLNTEVIDIGLVKNVSCGKGVKFYVETKVARAFGYLDPEYAAIGRLTTKVSIYAFGVVLMELITGHKALDEIMPKERCHLVSCFRSVQQLQVLLPVR